MKLLAGFILIALFGLGSFAGYSQNYGDKEFYLIDSLDLDRLSEYDKNLVDSCLSVFHEHEHDTMKAMVLSHLIKNSWNENVWPAYNKWMYEFVNRRIDKQDTDLAKKSLKKALASAINNFGFYESKKSNYTLAIEYYRKSMAICREVDDKAGIAVAQNNIAHILLKNGKVKEALDMYQACVRLYKGSDNIKGAASAYNNIGYIYDYKGDIIAALHYYNLSLTIRLKERDKEGQSLSYSNIGAIYNTQGEVEKAIFYFKKSLRLRIQIGNQNGVATILNKIADIDIESGLLDSAELNYKKALAIFEDLKNIKGVALGLGRLGDLYRKRGVLESKDPNALIAFNKSLSYYLKSLAVSEEINLIKEQASTMTNIANTYLLMDPQNGYIQALPYANKSLILSVKLGFPIKIKDAAMTLSYALLQKGQSKTLSKKEAQESLIAAMVNYKLSIEMRDSLKNDKTEKAALQQRLEHEFDLQKTKTESEHEKELAISTEAHKRQTLLSYSIGAGLLMLLVFAVVIFNRLKHSRKQNRIIAKQKKIVEKSQEKIVASITYAKRIQRGIIPTAEDFNQAFPESFIFYRPKDIVSGDFYWMYRENKRIIFTVADCTGHGVPGAFVSLIGANSLLEVAKEKRYTDAGTYLEALDKAMTKNIKGSQDEITDGMASALIIINSETGIVDIAGAENSVFIIRKSDALEVKQGDKLVDIEPFEKNDTTSLFEIRGTSKAIVSAANNKTEFVNNQLTLKKGDKVILFSDGFIDQKGGEKGKKYFAPRFRKFLIDNLTEHPTSNLGKKLEDEFIDWIGDKDQLDDVLVVGFEWNG